MSNEETLRRNIEDAILVLAPKFDISPEMLATFRKPSFVVGVKGENVAGLSTFCSSYSYEDAKIQIPSSLISSHESIGHEVGHYLHFELNPSALKRHFWDLELQELVGYYTEIIYSNSKGGTFSPISFWSYTDSGIPGHRTLEAFSHLARCRADRAFIRYGESLLPRLARMSVDEAAVALPRLLPLSFYERKILPLVDRLRGIKI